MRKRILDQSKTEKRQILFLKQKYFFHKTLVVGRLEGRAVRRLEGGRLAGGGWAGKTVKSVGERDL
jgi:hypothetical protein